MQRQTTVQSKITFKFRRQSKTIVFNGPIAEALTVIAHLYPGYCCVSGSTTFIKPETYGWYTITQTISGKVEHSLSFDTSI